MMSCSNSTPRGEILELKGLTLLKVIYQLDYRQQLLIKASHIWIYVPFLSLTQHGPMVADYYYHHGHTIMN